MHTPVWGHSLRVSRNAVVRRRRVFFWVERDIEGQLFKFDSETGPPAPKVLRK